MTEPGSKRSLGMGAVLATVPLLLAALAIAWPPPEGGLESPCSPIGATDVLDDLGPERFAYEHWRFQSGHIRWLPPARVCQIYAIPKSAAAPGGETARAHEVLVAEEANPEAWFYVLVPLLLVTPLAATWAKRRLTDRSEPKRG